MPDLRTGWPSTIRQTLPWTCLSSRRTNSTNSGALNFPSKTMKAKAPLLVMAEIMLQPKRYPVARISGVWPAGA